MTNSEALLMIILGETILLISMYILYLSDKNKQLLKASRLSHKKEVENE